MRPPGRGPSHRRQQAHHHHSSLQQCHAPAKLDRVGVVPTGLPCTPAPCAAQFSNLRVILANPTPRIFEEGEEGVYPVENEHRQLGQVRGRLGRRGTGGAAEAGPGGG